MREFSETTQATTHDSDVCKTASATQPSASWQRTWTVFICAIVGSLFMHEIGHCVVAWLHGYIAIPTPAKEYVLHPLPDSLQTQVALGGILGSVAALVA